MSTRNLTVIAAAVMVATWVLTYSIWAYEATPNTLEQNLRLLLVGFFLVASISQVGIVAWAIFLRRIHKVERTSK